MGPKIFEISRAPRDLAFLDSYKTMLIHRNVLERHKSSRANAKAGQNRKKSGKMMIFGMRVVIASSGLDSRVGARWGRNCWNFRVHHEIYHFYACMKWY